MTLIATWVSGEAGLTVVTVETIWDGTETDQEQAERHLQAVLDKLEEFEVYRP